MAKVAFSKLSLKVNEEVATFEENENTIEVKQYLPIESKLEMISNIINDSGDDNGFYNQGRLEMNIILKCTEYYTNIAFTEKQKETPAKLYDQIVSSGLWDDIAACMKPSELQWIRAVCYHMIDKIYEYRNSVYGILDAIGTDYKDLDLNAEAIKEKIGDPENLGLLKDVLSKLG